MTSRRAQWALVIVLALVLVGSAATGVVRRNASPPLPPIAFAGQTDYRQYDVFVADDADRDQLTDDKLSYAPSWSPDGSQIAFIRGGPGSWEECCGYRNEHIWMMDADGSDAHVVSPPQWAPASTPQWMPDGRSLVFTVIRKYQGNADAADLVDLDLASGEVSVLRPFLPTFKFTLSPDGQQIAQPRRDGIALVDIATGKERVIGDGALSEVSDIAWSSEGGWLAFEAVAMRTAAPRLWAWNLETAQLVPVETGGGEGLGHTWVDRNRLLYCYLSSGDDEPTQFILATLYGERVVKQPVTEFVKQYKDGETESCLGEYMDAQW